MLFFKYNMLMLEIGDPLHFLPPCVDCLWSILFLTVEIFHGGGVKVGVAADGDDGAIGHEDGEQAGGDDLGNQIGVRLLSVEAVPERDDRRVG